MRVALPSLLLLCAAACAHASPFKSHHTPLSKDQAPSRQLVATPRKATVAQPPPPNCTLAAFTPSTPFNWTASCGVVVIRTTIPRFEEPACGGVYWGLNFLRMPSGWEYYNQASSGDVNNLYYDSTLRIPVSTASGDYPFVLELVTFAPGTVPIKVDNFAVTVAVTSGDCPSGPGSGSGSGSGSSSGSGTGSGASPSPGPGSGSDSGSGSGSNECRSAADAVLACLMYKPHNMGSSYCCGVANASYTACNFDTALQAASGIFSLPLHYQAPLFDALSSCPAPSASVAGCANTNSLVASYCGFPSQGNSSADCCYAVSRVVDTCLGADDINFGQLISYGCPIVPGTLCYSAGYNAAMCISATGSATDPACCTPADIARDMCANQQHNAPMFGYPYDEWRSMGNSTVCQNGGGGGGGSCDYRRVANTIFRRQGMLLTTSMQFAMGNNVVYRDGYGQAYFNVDNNKLPRWWAMQQAGPECTGTGGVHP